MEKHGVTPGDRHATVDKIFDRQPLEDQRCNLGAVQPLRQHEGAGGWQISVSGIGSRRSADIGDALAEDKAGDAVAQGGDHAHPFDAKAAR
ncbi:hypothetical protein ABIA22_005681 [Sinorhizobium fredii]